MANCNTHSFNVQLATEIGLEECIILQHFYYWHKINCENENMVIDDKVWFFTSRRNIQSVFPYLSEQKIKTCLLRLEEKGYILKENKNANKIVKANWYALTEKSLAIFGEINQPLVKTTNDWLKQPTNNSNNNIYNNIKETNSINTISKEKRFSLTPQMSNQSTEGDTPSPLNNQKINPNGSETRGSAPTTTAGREEREQAFREQADKFIPEYGRKMIDAFCDYWTEFGGKKMRFEKEKTWELKRRLQTWKRNDDERKPRYQRTATPTTPDNSLDAKEVLKNLGL